MNTAKIYHDSDGNECSIYQAVKREPVWAANRIQVGEDAIEEIAKLKEEISKLKRVCERSAHVLKRAEVHLPFDSDEECLVEEHLKEISKAAS